jgi:hypothetical protein
MAKPRHQPALDLGVLRRIIVDDEPGRITLRVLDAHRGGEVLRMEFTPEEADSMARHFWSASACASGLWNNMKTESVDG